MDNNTKECVINGLAGVIDEKLIYFQASVTKVVEFLTECYHEGKGYSTINTYRSALSTTLRSMHDDRGSLGSHPLVARLLKGVFILRPSTPRYSSTWDVSKVTDYLDLSSFA